MQKITPFLWFDTNAEEAMNYYVEVFKDSKVVNASRMPPGGPGEVGQFLVGEFQIEGQNFLVLNGGPLFKFNESVSFMIHCETQDEIDYYWSKLTADGGEESMCGWLKDKFGLSWQVTPTMLVDVLSDPDREKAGRAMQAMMTMQKLDIAGLQKAFDGE